MLPAASQRRQVGFTLIEMIIAVVVIGMLATTAVLLLRGPIALQMQQQRENNLLDEAGLFGMRLRRELAQAQAARLEPAGAGFTLRFDLRPPSAGTVRYLCQPNATNPALGALRRAPGGLLLRNVRACRAMDPQSPAYRAEAGRSQLVEMAVSLADGEQRADVFYALRVGP